jgi:molybdopterin-guanine dinucleotide biosynthesis protein B
MSPDCRIPFPIPVLGIAARSGTGKTSLIERLIPALIARGLRVGAIKRSHHDFEIDRPGKDSDRMRRAGARQVLLASAHRSALITEGDGRTEPQLPALLLQLDPNTLDLVLVEGFRRDPIPKLEVHRRVIGHPMLCLEDPCVIAVVTDAPVEVPPGVLALPLEDAGRIAAFVVEWMVS